MLNILGISSNKRIVFGTKQGTPCSVSLDQNILKVRCGFGGVSHAVMSHASSLKSKGSPYWSDEGILAQELCSLIVHYPKYDRNLEFIFLAVNTIVS